MFGSLFLIKIPTCTQHLKDTILKKLPDSGVLYTTKSDKVNHGLGTKNVKEVVNRYEGIYDNSIEDGRFMVDIII